MRYPAGKKKIAKRIASYLNTQIKNTNSTTYIEPFCGVFSVGSLIECDNVLGSDKNIELIDMMNNIDKIDTSIPSKEKWYQLKNEPSSPTRTYWGYQGSFIGKFYGSYGNKLCSVLPDKGRGILTVSDYTKYELYEGCFFYLDPPYIYTYFGNSISKTSKYIEFAKRLAKKNIVYLSERALLREEDGFEVVLEQEVKDRKYKAHKDYLYRVVKT